MSSLRPLLHAGRKGSFTVIVAVLIASIFGCRRSNEVRIAPNIQLIVVDDLCALTRSTPNAGRSQIIINPQIVAIARDGQSGCWLFQVRESRRDYTYAQNIDYFVLCDSKRVVKATLHDGEIRFDQDVIVNANVSWEIVVDSSTLASPQRVKRAVARAKRR